MVMSPKHHLPSQRLAKRPAVESSSLHFADSQAETVTSGSSELQQDASRRASDTSTSSSFLRRRFSSAWVQRRRSGDEEGTRGPLGLHLLFSSPEPLIDVIFVHGLRGGSIKSWRKGTDPRFFWPQCWLPVEPGFRHANIHSFGYDSDWGSTKPSILNVHDFGRSLYEEMRVSPHLRDRTTNPIILVGHSMGGLVIKKAYTLAHRDKAKDQFSQRIRCLFFLATPHRGSDYAAVLNQVLRVSGIMVPREYINDLTSGSTSTQIINDDFGRYANELLVYSFYETLQTSLGGVSSVMIVEKNSAILGPGFSGERVQYLSANHRDICKFDSLEDSNYITLKNALETAVHDLLKDVFVSNEQKFKAQLRVLQTFLGVSGIPDEQYEKLEGSCRWIEDRDDFKEWRDSPDSFDDDQVQSPLIYWVNANPGAGKTVLAGHVVSQLKEFRMQHASYYFHFGKKASQSLAGMLRSIAYQMASGNAAIRDALLKINDEGSSFDQDDARAIWSKIFRAGLFQTSVITPQYWVVDAIDECVKYTEFFTLLRSTQTRFPLRIFITSRKVAEMPRVLKQMEGLVMSLVEIPIPDTMRDIQSYVEARMDLLPIDSVDEKNRLSGMILGKSGASFLWVRLVLDELQGVYGYESILQVLQEIPEGMVPYYQRTVGEMADNKREKHIAKAMLMWVVTAARPLSISELSEGLKLDINVHLPSARSAIEGLCGQLVTVDEQTGMVHLVHSTAREFLLSPAAGEFFISRPEAHERMALNCLRLLSSAEMQPPRNRRLLGQHRPGQIKRPESKLMDYAISQFSEHVFGASAENDEVLAALDRFFATTVLSWIEKVATKKDIHLLIRASRNLRAYLDRSLKYRSPLNRQVNNVERWATDLSRLTAKFSSALMASPQSIHFLIPPMCPTESAICRHFGRSPDGHGLVLAGLNNSQWDDCIANISFDQETSAAVACGNNLIAVGFESGSVHLYNQRSFQQEQVIYHEFPVDLIHFDPLGSFVASCSTKFVALWDMKGNLLWKTRLRTRCILLSSSPNFILGVTQQGTSFKWDIASGSLLEKQSYTYQPPDPDAALQSDLVKAPYAASVSPDLETLALAYRNGPICMFDLQSEDFIGWVMDGYNRAPAQLMFNPNPDVGLLLVAYNESHLGLYDSWSGGMIHSLEPEKPAAFISVASSPDGRTLATVDILGNLRILDFKSLTILYHVMTHTPSFRILEFTSDAFNLVDVVGSEMRVWSPSALVRKTVEEEASMSEQAAVLPIAEGQHDLTQSSRIRHVVAHELLPAAFAGKHSGEVWVYNTKSGRQADARVLYSHQPGASIKCLAVSQADLMASADINGVVQVWQLCVVQPTAITTSKLRFRVQLTRPVRQILFDKSGGFLLISTTNSDAVYATADGSPVGSIKFTAQERSVWKWLPGTGAQYNQCFILIVDRRLIIYSAEAFPNPIDIGTLSLDYPVETGFAETEIETAAMQPETSLLIINIRQQCGYMTNSMVFLFRMPASVPVTSDSTLSPIIKLPARCDHFIGISKQEKRLLFLQHKCWVSSIDVRRPNPRQYSRHFFVPNEFTSTSSEVLPVRTVDDDIVFCLHGNLAYVKNGLKFEELRPLEP
ncbi:NACHT and WD domain protein [Pseudomassariella vexata]|uniref:NACHT and WD domain protein n=1 Tax=Pseudomassariella vexata TaxID=1141098 RepID=A0A1Y2DQG1_9PEZI|nr:NACHT and WD domain protein [Pseudomassariella vexata]ORY60895.1 NACHT and WD domain protein [Pseudomassariella vexata]